MKSQQKVFELSASFDQAIAKWLNIWILKRLVCWTFQLVAHLASTLTDHHEDGLVKNYDALDTLSAYPNFQIMVYPVITFSAADRHNGSKESLIGKESSDELFHYYSSENHVTADTPPTFLIHATDDKSVPVEISLLVYVALKYQNMHVRMHIYPAGGHGYALALGLEYLERWTGLLVGLNGEFGVKVLGVEF